MFDFLNSGMWWLQTLGGAAMGIGLGVILVVCFNFLSAFLSQLMKSAKFVHINCVNLALRAKLGRLEQHNHTLSAQLIELKTENKELTTENKSLRELVHNVH